MKLICKKHKHKMSILEFIDQIRHFFITSQFKSLEDVKEFDWSKESIEDAEEPIVRFYTEGMCYWFAKMLQDAYPGGRMCVRKRYAHIVYYYEGKVYDITGEIKNKRAKYVPIEYFGDFIDDFKHTYVGGTGARYTDIINGYRKAEENNDIIQVR